VRDRGGFGHVRHICGSPSGLTLLGCQGAGPEYEEDDCCGCGDWDTDLLHGDILRFAWYGTEVIHYPQPEREYKPAR
jgi:hypothetical protein